MKSLYNKIFKNNQIIYGRPFQVKVPVNFQNIEIEDEEDEVSCYQEEILPEPEDLLENAKRECELIIKEAELEADRILEEAQRKADMEARDKAEEAWQKGYAEGMEAACSQNEAILAEAEQIRKSAAQEHESVMAGLESEMIELVLKIARKAVAGELATNREVIRQLVLEALPNCSNKNGAVLKVSPADYDFLTENKEFILSDIEGADSLEIKREGNMKQGDCIIETSLGSVDAGVNTRLEKIEEAFGEILGS